MTSIIYDLIFLVITIFILLKVIGYAIYEINQLNKAGGISIICFSVLVVVFANVMMWIK